MNLLIILRDRKETYLTFKNLQTLHPEKMLKTSIWILPGVFVKSIVRLQLHVYVFFTPYILQYLTFFPY